MQIREMPMNGASQRCLIGVNYGGYKIESPSGWIRRGSFYFPHNRRIRLPSILSAKVNTITEHLLSLLL